MASAVSLESPRTSGTPVSEAPPQQQSIAQLALQTIKPLSRSLASHNLAALERDAAFQELFSKELFRRLSPEEKKALRAEVDALEQTGWRPTTQDLAAFKTAAVEPEGDWTVKAISCFMKGRLNEDQIARLFLTRSCAFDGGNCYQLFEGKKADQALAFTLFEESMRFAELSDDQMRELYERLRQLPPEETQFYVHATAAMSKQEVHETLAKGDLIDISNFFQGYFDFPFFFLKKVDEECELVELIQVVPSPRLFQEILNYKFGANAMIAVPVFGYFRKEKMSDPSRRTIGLPGIANQPDRVHNIISSSRRGFLLHDYYHLTVESANIHRDLWVGLALDQTEPTLRVDLLDRHFPLYLRKKLRDELNLGREPTPQEIFWYSLTTSIDAPSLKEPGSIDAILRSVKKLETTPEFQAAGISIDQLRALVEQEPESVPAEKRLFSYFSMPLKLLFPKE